MASLLCPLQKIKTSSTKRRWVMFKFGDIAIPWNSPCDFSSAMALLSASTISKKEVVIRGILASVPSLHERKMRPNH
jgi:hypothetical protein